MEIKKAREKDELEKEKLRGKSRKSLLENVEKADHNCLWHKATKIVTFYI